MSTHYISDRGDHLITHDGRIQLGCFPHRLEDHYRLNPKVEWTETDWIPDSSPTTEFTEA